MGKKKALPGCSDCAQLGFIPVLPAVAWNIKGGGRPIPVCDYHRMAKSVDWDEGLRLFLVWKVTSE